jgi:hypothetical protein
VQIIDQLHPPPRRLSAISAGSSEGIASKKFADARRQRSRSPTEASFSSPRAGADERQAQGTERRRLLRDGLRLHDRGDLPEQQPWVADVAWLLRRDGGGQQCHERVSEAAAEARDQAFEVAGSKLVEQRERPPAIASSGRRNSASHGSVRSGGIAPAMWKTSSASAPAAGASAEWPISSFSGSGIEHGSAPNSRLSPASRSARAAQLRTLFASLSRVVEPLAMSGMRKGKSVFTTRGRGWKRSEHDHPADR